MSRRREEIEVKMFPYVAVESSVSPGVQLGSESAGSVVCLFFFKWEGSECKPNLPRLNTFSWSVPLAAPPKLYRNYITLWNLISSRH